MEQTRYNAPVFDTVQVPGWDLSGPGVNDQPEARMDDRVGAVTSVGPVPLDLVRHTPPTGRDDLHGLRLTRSTWSPND